MKIKSLRFVLIAMVIAMLPQQGIADGHKKTMWDVITNDDRFATFAVMVENAGVEHLFNGKTAINATVYVPTNFAFSTVPQAMTSALRFPENKGPLSKLIKSHYFIGTVNNMKEGDYFMTTNINGDQIRIEQEKNLFVKDMIIQERSNHGWAQQDCSYSMRYVRSAQHIGLPSQHGTTAGISDYLMLH
jgi:uncharacterized surface protein with fasciclin (FAS1) repeats